MARQWLGRVFAAVCALAAGGVQAQEIVHFPSLDGQATLTGYYYRVGAAGRHPALVFMHGCGGLFSRGTVQSREAEWMARFTGAGDAVLMVDSFGPRGQVEMCTAAHQDVSIYAKRARDAYGALAFLQAQPDIRPDRVGIIGWSQGGGTVLHTVGTPSFGRPAAMAQPDFRAAVAFYPSQCSDKAESASWTTTVPLLVLLGSDDVWIKAPGCERWIKGLGTRGGSVTVQMYQGAAHDFDFPNLPRRDHPEWTVNGIVPVTGTDPAARADALQRVPAFLASQLMN